MSLNRLFFFLTLPLILYAAHTTPYRIGQERKNFTVNLSVAGHKYYISWLVAIGIKSFHRGLF